MIKNFFFKWNSDTKFAITILLILSISMLFNNVNSNLSNGFENLDLEKCFTDNKEINQNFTKNTLLQIKIIYSFYSQFAFCSKHYDVLDTGKRIVCMFKAKDILTLILTDDYFMDIMAEKSYFHKTKNIHEVKDLIYQQNADKIKISDATISDLYNQFSFLSNIENSVHCAILQNMRFEKNCLDMFQKFLWILLKSLDNTWEISTIEDLGNFIKEITDKMHHGLFYPIP